MRIPAPPAPLLSPDGRLVGSLYDTSVTFVDRRGLEVVAEIELTHRAVSLAYAPESSWCAVGGTTGVTLLRIDATPSTVSTAAADHPVWRLAVGPDPFAVVGVERLDEHQTALAGWRGQKLGTWFPVQRLGATAAFTLELDPARQRAVLAGRRGPGGFNGQGERFTGAVALSEEGVTRTWNGEGLPFAPDGYLYPLEEGRLGVYGHDELVVLGLPDHDGEPATVVSRSPLDGAIGVVRSPGGKYLAWLREATLTVCPRADTTDRRSIQLSDELGEFVSLAVDDDGRVTVAAGAHPGLVRLFTAGDDALMLLGEVTVPHEPLD